MSTDPFDQLLDLENDYYQEGFGAGVADSSYAGMIEGKVFGIEKGYEKAVELGKLHGRALIWQARSRLENASVPTEGKKEPNLSTPESSKLGDVVQRLAHMPDTGRLQRHVEALHTASDASTLVKDNLDEAVTEFDDRIARAKAKAKVIANIVGESLNPISITNAGIEDATGLQARH
ncbi:hypothetical protein H2200_000104 [Cladophialophora chaetospira]|uniref:Essential protein Yae1 N-terminal domain-containing protein n=1 Tax=Cladophialophora chaetospira TaxID=386627 RepID=A0AA38XNN5_9EURO|nr:hypothetical protein H2200_000104 [Cladophialophora chaetospira]